MVNIENYLNDGANWQAVCVLACLRSCNNLKEGYNIEVGRFENCREQGYIFTLVKDTNGVYRQIAHYAVYEHRNSDQIALKRFHGNFLNTPTIDHIPYKDKYDVTEWFECGEITKVVNWLNDDFTLFMEDPFWDIYEDKEAIYVVVYDKENDINEDFMVFPYQENKTIMKSHSNEYYILNIDLNTEKDIEDAIQHYIDINGIENLKIRNL